MRRSAFSRLGRAHLLEQAIIVNATLEGLCM
jgi:hypothetical protein